MYVHTYTCRLANYSVTQLYTCRHCTNYTITTDAHVLCPLYLSPSLSLSLSLSLPLSPSLSLSLSFPFLSSFSLPLSLSLSLASLSFPSFRYATYLVLLSKFLPHPDSLEVPMFFGFVGLLDGILLIPLVVSWHYFGLETFELPPTNEIWTILLFNGFVGTVLSELLWLW